MSRTNPRPSVRCYWCGAKLRPRKALALVGGGYACPDGGCGGGHPKGRKPPAAEAAKGETGGGE